MLLRVRLGKDAGDVGAGKPVKLGPAGRAIDRGRRGQIALGQLGRGVADRHHQVGRGRGQLFAHPLLLGLVAGNETGINGIAVYIMVYTFMNLGAFLVIVALRRQKIIGEDLEDISGLMHKSPGYAILMLVFLLSLSGIPPTAGFIGKYYIFLSLVETGHYYLAVLAVGYAVVALYYYFRIVVAMFMKKATDTVPLATSLGLRVALGVSLCMTLVVGIYPQPFIVWAQEAIRPFFSS